jgi:hypothetical protein
MLYSPPGVKRAHENAVSLWSGPLSSMPPHGCAEPSPSLMMDPHRHRAVRQRSMRWVGDQVRAPKAAMHANAVGLSGRQGDSERW